MTAWADLESLDGLALRVRRGMGDRPGDRRFPGRPQPSGIEIEAHSPYMPGDDLRHLDWNAVGRLDALLVRRFTAERDVVVHLLLDCSTSMTVPARDRKLAVAAELCLALAYLALSANDAVRVTFFANEALSTSPVFRQRGSLPRIAALLEGAPAGGRVVLGDALAAWAARHRRPGLAVVVSDFMTEPAEIERGVLALRASRHEVVLLHVVGRGELEPARELSGGLFRDVESGATHPVALGPAALDRYAELLDGHLRALAALAERARAIYARLPTDAPVRDFVAVELPRLGVVARR